MDFALVAGGNGLVGRSLVAALVASQTPTIVMGTSPQSMFDAAQRDEPWAHYIQVGTQGDWLGQTKEAVASALPDRGGDGVLFNLAWRGRERLVDGDLSEQLRNAALACSLIELGVQVRAERYIDVGSMEELILERYLTSGDWQTSRLEGARPSYSLAKSLAGRMSAFETYRNRIDYIHTRLSAAIDPNLKGHKYIETSLRDLREGRSIPAPLNAELCNLASTHLIAAQLIALATHGRNKTDYALGTGEAKTLRQYFTDVAANEGNPTPFVDEASAGDAFAATYLTATDFDIRQLLADTNMAPPGTTITFEETS